MLVPDTHRDARFREHPWVVGPPHVRFYAGYPIRGLDGSRVGTVALLDRKALHQLSHNVAEDSKLQHPTRIAA